MAIYFIQCGKNGPIKIGQTENGAEERMKQLQTACPYELELLWVYEGDDHTESGIHKMFSHENIRGEWFRPAKPLLDFIKLECSNEFMIKTANGRVISFQEVFNGLDNIFYKNKKTNIYNDLHFSENGIVEHNFGKSRGL